jgi:uncharacterized membrane protein
MSDLIVVGYRDEKAAQDVWEELVKLATYDKFVEALRPYGGTILRTSLSHEAEQQLMKILHGEDPKVPTWEQPTASTGAPASAT